MKLKRMFLEDKEVEALSYIFDKENYYGTKSNRRFFRGESDDIKTFKLKRIRTVLETELREFSSDQGCVEDKGDTAAVEASLQLVSQLSPILP